MKIHREGYKIITAAAFLLLALAILLLYHLPYVIGIILAALLVCEIFFIIRFFRVPRRDLPADDNLTVYSPADGTIVAIEEVFEDEYLKENRIQVSIFMSLMNVHINWFPVGGRVEYFKKHDGRFLVAWHPKSSIDNERTTTVIDTGKHRVMFRQIAGFLARRIVSYAPDNMGKEVAQNSQCGIIKFGSRVDVFLPLDSQVIVNLGDKVVGTQTPLAVMSEMVGTQ